MLSITAARQRPVLGHYPRAFGAVGTDHYGADMECQINEVAVYGPRLNFQAACRTALWILKREFAGRTRR
jgi:hypothetical protein